MWISKEKYKKLQQEVADSKVERYYHNFDTSCIGSNGDTVTIGALSCVVNCKHCIEYGGNNTDHPWVRCRKRPEGRSIEQAEIMKDKFDGITKAILGIKDDGKPKEVLSWEKLYYEGHAKWNAECLNLKNRIKELEAQLDKKEYSKLPFVAIRCTAESKWDDVVKDPKNKNKTTTEKEYLKNNYWDLSNKDKDFIDNFHSVVLHCTTESEKEQPKEKEVEVKPYYFDKEKLDILICSEFCDIKNDGTCIGSVSCRDCEYCIFCSKDFIKCKLKPEGKAKPEPKKPEWDTTNIGGIKISTLKQEPKKPESIKFDKYGVISETKNNDYCDLCIYTNELASSEVCQHCTNNNKSNEYYSSK